MNKPKPIKSQFRQGDVLIDFNQPVPTDATKQKKGRVILAHGEVTGHAHEIHVDSADAWKQGEETVGIEVKKPSKINHQEHGPIPVKRGAALVRRQSQYSPEAIRSVAD